MELCRDRTLSRTVVVFQVVESWADYDLKPIWWVATSILKYKTG